MRGNVRDGGIAAQSLGSEALSRNVPARSCNVPAPSRNVSALSRNVPAPSCNVPAPSRNVPAPSCNVPAQSCNVPALSFDAEAQSGNSDAPGTSNRCCGVGGLAPPRKARFQRFINGLRTHNILRGSRFYGAIEDERCLISLAACNHYGVVVPTGRVLGLVNKGWRRGEAQDGGGIWYFLKPLGDGNVIELDLDPGIIVDRF